jgi:DnaJ-domain-containing protein 1
MGKQIQCKQTIMEQEILEIFKYFVASQEELEIAKQYSILLNNSYETLKKPSKRAEYMVGF